MAKPLIGVKRAITETSNGGVKVWGNKKEWKLTTAVCDPIEIYAPDSNGKMSRQTVTPSKYVLTHYGTPILEIRTAGWDLIHDEVIPIAGQSKTDKNGNDIVIGRGAYSPSDRDAINSMLEYLDIPMPVSISGGYMHFRGAN